MCLNYFNSSWHIHCAQKYLFPSFTSGLYLTVGAFSKLSDLNSLVAGSSTTPACLNRDKHHFPLK